MEDAGQWLLTLGEQTDRHLLQRGGEAKVELLLMTFLIGMDGSCIAVKKSCQILLRQPLCC